MPPVSYCRPTVASTSTSVDPLCSLALKPPPSLTGCCPHHRSPPVNLCYRGEPLMVSPSPPHALKQAPALMCHSSHRPCLTSSPACRKPAEAAAVETPRALLPCLWPRAERPVGHPSWAGLSAMAEGAHLNSSL
jgi:hypothetical protein